jgi:hypothetical protein
MIELAPGGKVVQSINANRMKLKKWIKTDPAIRPFLFLAKKTLSNTPSFDRLGCNQTQPSTKFETVLPTNKAMVFEESRLL